MNEDQQGINILYIAESLDGYIATKDDSLEWLFKIEGEGDNGYSEFIKDIDCIVMGRKTYEWIIKETKNEFPYKGKKCFVLSKSCEALEFADVVRTNVTEFIEMTKRKYKRIWIVGGGEVVREYIKNNMIDEYRITIAPVLIGNGIRLFKENENKIELKLKEIRRRNQFIEVIYIK